MALYFAGEYSHGEAVSLELCAYAEALAQAYGSFVFPN